MNVRFKMTNKGEVAILPRKEYEALAAKAREADEDIGTARLVAHARKEIAAGIPLIPKEIVDRIVAGENALRLVRKWRGKTQLYLSSISHLGQGYISDLESGRRKGTTTSLKKIADVLKVPLDLIASLQFLRPPAADGYRHGSRHARLKRTIASLTFHKGRCGFIASIHRPAQPRSDGRTLCRGDGTRRACPPTSITQAEICAEAKLSTHPRIQYVCLDQHRTFAIDQCGGEALRVFSASSSDRS